MDFGAFQLQGFSLGGIETCVVVPQWSLAVDIGRGRQLALRCNHIALTHTHMDHAGGMPYLLALRQLYGMAPPTIYLPDQMADRFVEMMAAWDRLQRFESHFELVRARPGERYRLNRELELVPFRTYHIVPSLGWSVVRTVDKLKPELVGTEGHELARMKREGIAITDPQETTLLSVTGDTLPEVLDRQPQILDSEVLMMECTFLDDRKPYEKARAGGHVHLDDLLARAGRLTPQTLVLSHFSQIYRPDQLPELLRPLAEAIPGQLRAFPMAPEDDETPLGLA